MFKQIFFAVMISVTVFSSFALGDTTGSNVPNANSTVPADDVPAEFIDSASFGFDLNVITHQGITGSTRQSWIRNGVNYFLERIIGLLAGVIGTICILIISWGGLLMLSSAGNEEQYQKGVGMAKYALLGLVFTLTAYILVNLVQLLVKSIYG